MKERSFDHFVSYRIASNQFLSSLDDSAKQRYVGHSSYPICENSRRTSSTLGGPLENDGENRAQ